jgi:hypothetical protein
MDSWCKSEKSSHLKPARKLIKQTGPKFLHLRDTEAEIRQNYVRNTRGVKMVPRKSRLSSFESTRACCAFRLHC